MSPKRENYYDDSPEPAAAPEGGQPEAKEGDEGGQTFIAPRSAFMGKELKPGDRCDVEVVAVHENDIELKGCEQGDESAEKPQPEAAPEMGGGDGGGMASLME